MPSSSSRAHHTRAKSSVSQRTSVSRQPKTEIIVNVYDLLPPGRLATTLWHLGGSLLHSGVVINGREYAYGGHSRRGLTGVYWTKPRLEPPGARFRVDLLQGFTFHDEAELDAIIREVSDEFPGTGYNLLTNNCNHFTSALCQRLTSKPSPAWLNRAASIGLAMPCVVPREWIQPPDVATADGALVEERENEEADDDDDGEYGDEQSPMLDRDVIQAARRQTQSGEHDRAGSARIAGLGIRNSGESTAGRTTHPLADGRDDGGARLVRDTAGRELPIAEHAPMPKQTREAGFA